MHNQIKEVVSNVLEDYEVKVTAKIKMDNDFFASLLSIKLYESLAGSIPVAATRPTTTRRNKKKEEPLKEEGSLLHLNIPKEDEV